MQYTEATAEARQAVRALLVVLAVTLALAWQVMLLSVPEGTGVSPLTVAVALPLFVWVAVRQPPDWLVARVARWMPPRSVVFALLAVACSAMVVALDVAYQQLGRTYYFPVLMLWLAAGAIFFVAFVPRLSWPVDWRAWVRAHRAELLAIAAIALLGAFLRLYRLGITPRVLDGDAGLIGMSAVHTAELPLASPFALWENFGSLYLQVVAVCIDLFGRAALPLRLLPAISGLLSVPAVFLLGRRLFGARVGLIAAALLAVAHLHIHFSRVAPVGYIHATLLVPLELYFFISGIEDRSAWRLALGGLILGVHFCVYLSVQVVAVYMLVYLLVAAALCRPLVRGALRQIPVFWGGALVTGLPLLAFAVRKPDEFFNRLNASGTFQGQWLAQTMTATGKNAFEILFERVVHAVLSLNHYRAFDFYGSSLPVLDAVTAALVFLGMGYALWRTRDHRYLLLNGYFWSLTLALALFATPPSADSYRMLVVLPAVMLFAAIALDQLVRILGLDAPGRRIALVTVLTLLAVLVSSVNLQAYFVDFANNCRQGLDTQTRFAHYLGSYLSTLEVEQRVYLLSDGIYRAGTHASTEYLSGGYPVTNVSEPITGTLNLRPGTILIAPPSRAEELSDWARAHPGSEIVRQVDCGKVMLTAYEVP